MRPLVLEMSAFGSYANKTIIDFRKLNHDGLYLVAGDTGAGKTTIFDAITYALYGKASGSNREDTKNFRSNYADETTDTYVELLFENRGTLYVIRRSPEFQRKSKKSGTGDLVKQKPKASLCYYDENDAGEVLATDPEKVTKKVVELIGVDGNQFTQMAMLAQGEFLKLLFAKTSERKEIFRRLFHTEKYDEIQKAIQEDFRQIEATMGAMNADVKSKLELVHVSKDDLQDTLDTLRGYKIPDPDAVLELLQQQKEEDRTSLEELARTTKEYKKELELVTAQIAKGEEYEKDTSLLEELKRKEEAVKLAAEQAKKEYTEKKKESTKAEEFIAIIDSLRKSLTEYDRLENAAAEQKRRQAIVLDLETKRDQRVQQVAEAESKLDADRKAVGDLAIAREKRIEVLADLDKRRDLVKKLSALLDAMDHLDDLWKENHSAVKRYCDARRIMEDAGRDYQEKNRLFLDEQAGILAQSLQEDIPCPVCGSLHHPNPANAAEGAPTEAELKEAEEKSKQAIEIATNLAAEVKEKETRVEEQKKWIENELSHFFLQTGNLILEERFEEVRKDVEGYLKSEEKALEDLTHASESLREKIDELSRTEAGIPGEEQSLKSLRENLEDIIRQHELEGRNLQSAMTTLEEIKKHLSHGTKAEAEAEVSDYQKKVDRIKNEISEAEKKSSRANSEYDVLIGNIRQLTESLSGRTKVNLDVLCVSRDEINEKMTLLSEEEAICKGRFDTNEDIATFISALQKEMKNVEHRWRMVRELMKTVTGDVDGMPKMDLDTYAQIRYFDRILERANTRFEKMTGGQYTMVPQKPQGRQSKVGMDIDVVDHHNGSLRNIKTLSGGECFMASLALALGLSDEVTANSGGVKLDSLFVDEGFGSLDGDVLQVSVNVLQELAGDNRQIGIISHVGSLVNMVDHMIMVTKDSKGISSAVVE